MLWYLYYNRLILTLLRPVATVTQHWDWSLRYNDFRRSVAQRNSRSWQARETASVAFRAKHKKWPSFWNCWEWRRKFCSRSRVTWVAREGTTTTTTTTTQATTVFRLCNDITTRYYASVIWGSFVLKFALAY